MGLASNELFANIVMLLHWVLVGFLVYSPFSPYPALWVLSTISLIFVLSHWVIPGPNQDTCALTLLERYLRGCDKQESFMHQIVSPVYKLVSPDGACSDAFTGRLVWTVSILLVLIGLFRIVTNWKRVKNAFTKGGECDCA